MSEALPQNAGFNLLNAALGPSPSFMDSPGGPLPVLSNSRIAGRCRVVGCPTDLNTQTNTNRKYYLCRDHWAADAVLADGIPQRFCGQCSRFKLLGEYDGPKRTCRQCLFLRNTKKRNQRHESLQRGTYGSPGTLPPYQLNRGKYLPTSSSIQNGLAGSPFLNNNGRYDNNYYNDNNNTAAQLALLQHQLQQLQQALPAEALAAAVPQHAQQQFNNGGETIDTDSLETVLSLIATVGVLGDGHTGNAEADALFYLFQELKTLKHEVEIKGVAVASMEAKRRKVTAEQELARANLEVAEIEEQLIRIAAVNKQQQQQGTTTTSDPIEATTVLTDGGILKQQLHKALNGPSSEGPSSLLPLPPAPETTDEPILARQSSSG